MRGRPPGFTLLELLVALAVFGMLVVMLNQGVAFGLRATSMQGRADDRQGDLDAVDRALRRIIEDADPGIFPEPATLKGTTGSVSMITELPDRLTGRPERAEATIFASGGDLRLRWRKRRHVAPFGPPPPAQEMVLLQGVRSLQIGYSAGDAFLSSWSAERLPKLVRLKLDFADSSRHWPPILATPKREPLGQ